MPDRSPRNVPERSSRSKPPLDGPFRESATPSRPSVLYRRNSASSPPIAPPSTDGATRPSDWPSSMAPDVVKNLSTALNESIRTLPVWSGTNPTETDSPQPAVVISAPATPLLGRSTAAQEQSHSSEESPKSS